MDVTREVVAPVLCIIQARYHSTRLPAKMLCVLGGETLIGRAWRIARAAFPHCVVALPAPDLDGPLGVELRRIGAAVFPWDGPESDVLGRLWHCAHSYRWHPASVILRYTPDDPFKDKVALQHVAAGDRLPVEHGGEAFTLAMLDHAHTTYGMKHEAREHITRALFPTAPPSPGPGIWTIDTADDLTAAQHSLENPPRE